MWKSTIEICSNECKNATVELYNDLYGQHLRGCDCGARPLYISPPPEQVKCFKHKIKMQEVCKIDDTIINAKIISKERLVAFCIELRARQFLIVVCSYSCDEVRSVCTNDTDCNIIWNKYKTYCTGVILWNHNTTMPTCTDQCKKRIEELENNPIGKYMKCCGCDQENEEEKMDCISERQNVAIVCDVDFNHVNNCHNNLSVELCVNDTFEKHENSDRLGRYCVVIELFSVGKVSFNYTDSADNPLTWFE